MRRAPLEPEDDAYELQDHEFTLEPEEPADESSTPPDERTASPLPAWADTSRALLEPAAAQARSDAVFYDDQPTPSDESVECSRSVLLALREELVLAARESREHAEQIQRLERALAETRRSAAVVEAELTRENAELLGQVRGQAFLIGELQECVQVPLAAEITAVMPVVDRVDHVGDDLRRIRGLGKRFVERLAELGIRQFAQIAGWAPADVERIAPQLGVRPKRILREGWIKQAQKLSERAGLPPRRARKATPPGPARKRTASARKRAAR